LYEQYPIGQLEAVQSLDGHFGDDIVDVFAESKTLCKTELHE
jgi:hypothetical protein